MPSENMNIIYCTEVDHSGRIVNTSMIIQSNTRHLMKSATDQLQNRKEN